MKKQKKSFIMHPLTAHTKCYIQPEAVKVRMPGWSNSTSECDKTGACLEHWHWKISKWHFQMQNTANVWWVYIKHRGCVTQHQWMLTLIIMWCLMSCKLYPLISSNTQLQPLFRTDEWVTNEERLGGHHALAPDVWGDHGGLTDVTSDFSPTLCDIVHTGGQHSAL